MLVWMKFDSRSPDVFFIFQMKWKREEWEFFCDKVKWRTVPGSVHVMLSPPCLQLCVQSVFGCWAVSFWLSSLFPLSAPGHIPDLTSDLWAADCHSRRRQTDVCIHFVCRKFSHTCFTVFFLEKKTLAFCPNRTINVDDFYQNVTFHSKLSCVKVVEMRNWPCAKLCVNKQ